jgi:hypothetical protein
VVYPMSQTCIEREYVDPMTSIKPEYTLAHSDEQVNTYSGLSFINDTAFHRENLMAAQQAKFNQSRIQPYF